MEVSLLLIIWSFLAPFLGAAGKWFFYDRRKLKADVRKQTVDADAVQIANEREGLNKLERGADVLAKLIKQQEESVSRMTDQGKKIETLEGDKAKLERELDRKQGAIDEHRIERVFWAEQQEKQVNKIAELKNEIHMNKESHDKQITELLNQVLTLKQIMRNNGIEFSGDEKQGSFM